MPGSDAFAVIRRQRADIVFLRLAWAPERPFPSFPQAAGATDRAAARVIFVILSILLIPSPAVSRTGRDADARDHARREERQKTKAKDKGKRQDGQD